MSDRARVLPAVVLVALGAALVVASGLITVAAGLQLHFDEAQYWTWAQHLDWSYYSKGPMVAWLIAGSEALFGHGEWQVRLLAWIAHGAWLAAVFLFARDVWGEQRPAWWAVALVLTTPLYFSLGLVMTTDIWLFLFWTLGLWAVYRALILGRRGAWYGAGAAVGAGALTKLSIGLMPAAVGIAVLARRGLRHHLRDPHLWGGLALMAALMSPVLLWNAANDWAMLRHEGGHLDGAGWSLVRLPRFLLGQVLVLSPIIAGLAIVSLRRPPASQGQRLLWWLSLAWIGFFLLKALDGKVQINWPAPSYIALFILFSGLVPDFTGLRRGLLYAGMGLSIGLMAVAYYPYAFGLGAGQDAFLELRAWRGPIRELNRAAPKADFILAPRYHLASELAFYWPQQVPVYVAGSEERRRSQFDLWPDVAREAGRDGLWVSTQAIPPCELDRAFKRCRPLLPVDGLAPDGSTVRTFFAWHCEDYRPIDWPQPSGY